MLGTVVRAVVLAAALIALLGVPAASVQPDEPGNRCHGVYKAYSHVLANRARNGNSSNALTALAAVATERGCDVSGVSPVKKPAKPDRSIDDEMRNWEQKCDRIAEKLPTVHARAHGKSAHAFARQADRWDCQTD